jgi:hypothetical protein
MVETDNKLIDSEIFRGTVKIHLEKNRYRRNTKILPKNSKVKNIIV